MFRHHAADTSILSCNLPRLSFFVTKKGNEKSRCCEAARLAAKTMAAIRQSWTALLIDPFGA